MEAVNKNILIQKGISSIIGSVEIIERKGWGHPDKLADDLAEELSRAYARDTLSECGIILHHNFDKLCILGGGSRVSYGKGEMTNPIRVLINGRATNKFAGKNLNVEKLIKKTCLTFFEDRLPLLDLEKDLSITFNLSQASSPGQVYSPDSDKTRQHWFSPRGAEDLPEYKNLYSNDTSIGTGYAPLTLAENLVIEISSYLSYRPRNNAPKWLGTDVKVMAYACENNIDLIICAPQIARHVNSKKEYISNLEWIKTDIQSFLKKHFPKVHINLNINARDNFDKDELYLTAIGSSIESGDEGVVGRGNRINGLITSKRPMNLEGANGKNPVYHVGKVYNILANNIAKDIHTLTGSSAVVDLISKTGNDLADPWKILIQIDKTSIDENKINSIVNKHLEDIPALTIKLINSSTKEIGLS